MPPEQDQPKHKQIAEFVRISDWPCVGAKSAFQRGQITVKRYGNIHEDACNAKLLADVYAFVRSYRETRAMFMSFLAEFSEPYPTSEVQFEDALWERLQGLHELDRRGFYWDHRVESDPDHEGFSFSIGGEAFFIIGMHPFASRKSRRYPRPAMVFNLHDQFERLREDGRYERMRDAIRERDAQYCGSPNPVLRNFGEGSEARQYAGRNVEAEWRCPFHPKTPS
jgi:FPC/CPF motif-containing protein YcgG